MQRPHTDRPFRHTLNLSDSRRSAGQFSDSPPPAGQRLLYLTTVSPHSLLLIAAATVGGAVVLAVGMLLGNPLGTPIDGGGTDPTLARVTVLDVEITPPAEASFGDEDRR